MADFNEKQNLSNDEEKLRMQNTLLKQQEMLLKQFELLSKEREKKDDEIDFSKIFGKLFKRKNSEEISKLGNSKARIKQGLKVSGKVGLGFWDLIKLSIIREYKIYIPLGLSGFVLGIILIFVLPPKYKSTMVLSSGPMPNTYYSNLIYTLEDLVDNKSYDEVGRKLKITQEEAKMIKKINYLDYLDTEIEEDVVDSTILVVNRPFFKIYVEITDNTILPKLQSGLFTYLSTNNYTKKRRDVKRRILENNLRKLETELSLMDSLKVAIIKIVENEGQSNNEFFVKESGTGGGIILSEDKKLDVDPMETFNRSKSMHFERQETMKELLLIEDEVDIVDDFAEFSDPIFPKLIHAIFLGVIFGFFGYFVSLWVTLKKIKKID